MYEPSPKKIVNPKKGKAYTRSNEGKDFIYNRGHHITMGQIAKCAGVKQCTIQQNVNLLRKYVVPHM